IACLTAYNWPGNIRELENMMERTILFCEGPEIKARDLPVELAHLAGGPAHTPAPTPTAGARSTPIAAAPAHEPDAPASTAPSGPTTLTSLPAVAPPAGSVKEAVRAETERVERELIVRALEETGGNVTQAARKLKISRKSLQTKMKEFGLRDREITKA